MNYSDNIIKISKTIKLENIIIHAIIPTNDKVIFLSRDFKSDIYIYDHAKDWIKLNVYKNKDSPYGSFFIYSYDIDDTFTASLKRDNKVELIISANANGEKSMKVDVINYKLPLLPSNKSYEIIESLANVFFEGELDKKLYMLKSLIAWIDYHILMGVDQIFVNQPVFINEKIPDSSQFWIDILKPYLESNKVVLVLYEDKMHRYSHQQVIQNVSLWLNKGRCKWFATHDLDEFICPLSGNWQEGQNIKTLLASVPADVNYVQTNMVRVNTQDDLNLVYTAPSMASDGYMWTWHKCIVKCDDVYVLWVHIPTHWAKTKVGMKVKYMRINHYKSKNHKPSHSTIPSIPYDGLRDQHILTMDRIKQEYKLNLDLNDIIKHFDQKYKLFEKL